MYIYTCICWPSCKRLRKCRETTVCRWFVWGKNCLATSMLVYPRVYSGVFEQMWLTQRTCGLISSILRRVLISLSTVICVCGLPSNYLTQLCKPTMFKFGKPSWSSIVMGHLYHELTIYSASIRFTMFAGKSHSLNQRPTFLKWMISPVKNLQMSRPPGSMRIPPSRWWFVL